MNYTNKFVLHAGKKTMHNEVGLTPRTKVMWEQREQKIKDQLMQEHMFWANRNHNIIELKRYKKHG